MTSRYTDLVAALEELDEGPRPVSLFGQLWPMPTSVPAATVLRLMAGVPVDVVQAAGDICGMNNVDAWLERGINEARLWAVTLRVLASHRGGGQPAGDDQQGKHRAPTTGPPTSRSSGTEPLRRTSTGSTGSGSGTTSRTCRGESSASGCGTSRPTRRRCSSRVVTRLTPARWKTPRRSTRSSPDPSPDRRASCR